MPSPLSLFFNRIDFWTMIIPGYVIIILGITILITLCNGIVAQTLNDRVLDNMLEESDKNYHFKTGANPYSVKVYSFANETQESVFVASDELNSVWVFDGDTETKVKEIPVDKNPRGITYNTDLNRVYVANGLDNSVSVINGENNTKIKIYNETSIIDEIPVGEDPRGMESNDKTNKIYVANYDSDYVTVLKFNQTKTHDILLNRSNIMVGDKPLGIAVDQNTNKTYVAVSKLNHVAVIDGNIDKLLYYIPTGNSPTDLALYNNLLFVTNNKGDSVSMIHLPKYDSLFNGLPIFSFNIHNYIVYKYYFESNNDTKTVDIPVGKRPQGIDIIDEIDDEDQKKVYVANSGSNNVSVINITNIKNNSDLDSFEVEVGLSPYDIAVNDRLEKVYVVNKGSDSISVIDPVSDNLVGGVSFNIHPVGAGSIHCGNNSILVPMSEYFYLEPNATCKAYPNKGFEFVSWEQNLGNNSTLIASQSSPSVTIFDHFKDFAYSVASFFGFESTKKEAILKVNGFSEYTANFREISPPLPAEYWATLFGVIVSAIVGSWLTPLIIEKNKSRKQRSNIKYYKQDLETLFREENADMKSLKNLYEKKTTITDGFNSGRLNKDQYEEILKSISSYCEKIFRKEINSINTDSPNKDLSLTEIKNNILDVHADGILNESHRNLLRERLSKFEDKKTGF